MKPHLSLEEQCQLLIDRGLIVVDRVEFLDFLKNHNYYRLRGYFHPFLMKFDDSVSDLFTPGTEAQTIKELVDFDRRLSMLLFEVLGIFETRFRASVAFHASRVNPYLHLTADSFTEEFATKQSNAELSPYEEWLNGYLSALEKNRKTEFVRWHRDAKDGRLPIWAAVEILDLGKVSKLYRGLSESITAKIAEDFHVNAAFLKGTIACLNNLRNHVAHHTRIWNQHFTSNPTLRPSKLPYELLHLNEQSDSESHKLFTRLSLLLWFDEQLHFEVDFPNRLFQLLRELPQSESLALESMGFGDSFRKSSLWRNF
jgi:abortive infection bacteriophage resistance protein